METKTWTDPIVEEVRAAREALLREADYDLRQLHARIMESQKRHGERLVGKREVTRKSDTDAGFEGSR